MGHGVETAAGEGSCGGHTVELGNKFCVSTDLEACKEMDNRCHVSRKIPLYSCYITIKGESRGHTVPLDNNSKFLIKIPKCTKVLAR